MIKNKGLYDARFEHDACGVGAVVNISGEASHDIVRNGKQILLNLHHRGAAGADEVTGDGAGILMQIPDAFFRKITSKLNFKLPEKGAYGVAMIFNPKDEKLAAVCNDILERALSCHGLIAGRWRDVPTNPDCLGELALSAEPVTRQLFITPTESVKENLETKLYLARKRAEKLVNEKFGDEAEDFYIITMSSRTIGYKGMFMAHQLFEYYPDLEDEDMATALAVVHQRYSTNTFPNWKLAQPFRGIAHNGEINTLNGNRNRMRAREINMSSKVFGKDIDDLRPILDPEASDSACFDNVLELLCQSGRTMPHSIMMMMPEAFGPKYHISTDKRAFYEYHATIMEPWDGPAAMVFTDGKLIGGTLDRNGLRPCRYVVTKDGLVVLASEAGVIEFPEENIRTKGRLQPGKMFLVDTEQGRIITDSEIKGRISRRYPYRRWLAENKIKLPHSSATGDVPKITDDELIEKLKMFGYDREEINMILEPMGKNGQEPIGSMGNDTPLAVLSNRPRLLYDYFKQLFAQVTNPPIDPLREGLVMSLMLFVGKRRNILEQSPEHCRQLKLSHPILTNENLMRLRNLGREDFKIATVDALFDAHSLDYAKSLEEGLEKLVESAAKAIKNGASIVVISDRKADKDNAAIPALLATSAVQKGLVARKLRSDAGIIVESAEPREVMHFCLLCGFGANAINPYLALDALEDYRKKDKIELTTTQVQDNYIAAIKKGLLKTMSKMGISTLRSYRTAQLFEAIGLEKDFVDKYFTGTVSRIGGINIQQISKDTIDRHQLAFEEPVPGALPLDFDGQYHYRNDGEKHLWNPETITKVQHAVIANDKKIYDEYASEINNQAGELGTLRGLFRFKKINKPIPIDKVEPASEIAKRFCTGAMSHGSISKEAHECMAIAMNRLGGMSNTGEGGEDPSRYTLEENGDSKNSAIKQVASGRFGVTIEYLSQAKEIQIKMAQGAKPGEGGQLPGHKVTDEIAKLRYSTPGVTLISPPPHHDIYSIEDLAQLIYDLKCANPGAKVSVKLVSEVGVGTIAAGVAKGNADEVLVSGHDGGTGASPWSSIKHTGCPWEIGLAETQQVLVLNNLRDRIRVQADGQLKTGRDVAIAALLGAEQFGFGTVALITMGCIMMRKCHTGTCPIGICTQRPELRAKFTGKPEHLVRFMLFVAEELREIMAELGFAKVDDMVGKVECLEMQQAIDHYKAQGLDFSAIFTKPDTSNGSGLRLMKKQINKQQGHVDWKFIEQAKDAIKAKKAVSLKATIKNTDRTVGTILSNHIATTVGANALEDGSVKINLKGTAGQSFGAFLAQGIEMHLVGQANDYVGKGLSGGRIIVETPDNSSYMAHENIIIGNTALYGATRGELFINGKAGERFAVRNSGVTTVVEGLGDHGCEYMTGGTVVVLGQTGRNFAAGMSGGIAYVLDEVQLFDTLCNLDMVELENVWQQEDVDKLHYLIDRHYLLTGSTRAKRILDKWTDMVGRFVKVIPIDYKRVLEKMRSQELNATETTPATEEVFNG